MLVLKYNDKFKALFIYFYLLGTSSVIWKPVLAFWWRLPPWRTLRSELHKGLCSRKNKGFCFFKTYFLGTRRFQHNISALPHCWGQPHSQPMLQHLRKSMFSLQITIWNPLLCLWFISQFLNLVSAPLDSHSYNIFPQLDFFFFFECLSAPSVTCNQTQSHSSISDLVQDCWSNVIKSNFFAQFSWKYSIYSNNQRIIRDIDSTQRHTYFSCSFDRSTSGFLTS